MSAWNGEVDGFSCCIICGKTYLDYLVDRLGVCAYCNREREEEISKTHICRRPMKEKE